MLNREYKTFLPAFWLGLSCLLGVGFVPPAWPAIPVECQVQGTITLPNQVLPIQRSWRMDLRSLDMQSVVIPLSDFLSVDSDQWSALTESFLTRHAFALQHDQRYPNVSIDLYRDQVKIISVFNVFLPKLFKQREMTDSFNYKMKWRSEDRHKQSAVFDLALFCSPILVTFD